MFDNIHFLVTAIVILHIAKVSGLNDNESNQLNVLREYKSALSDKEFSQMLNIYTNDSMSPLEKEKLVVNYFSSLPRRIKLHLPVPIPFRSLPFGAQQKIKTIYYKNGIGFEDKLNQIKQLVQDILMNKISQNLEKVNDDPDSNIVEFKINITLQLKGYYNKDDLQEYLSKEELSKLNDLLVDKSLNHHEKSVEIGILLRRIFQSRQNANKEWPTLMGMENLPDAEQISIAQILFSENPTSDLRSFLEFYEDKMENESGKSRSRRYIPTRVVRRLQKSELVFRDRPQIYADNEN